MLDYVIGDSELSDWMRWVAVDKDGEVYGYSDRPYLFNSHVGAWSVSTGDECDFINKVDPPLDFTKCIWEVKN